MTTKNPDFCSLIGIPDHQGVLNVGGRLGAARGPEAFRKCFKRMQSREKVHTLVRDLGDIAVSNEIERNHEAAAKMIEDAHAASRISIVVGGGHDHGHSHLLGLSRKYKKLGCLNIDAHLDVRRPEPRITSGSPFYLSIDSGILSPSRFVEFGIQPHCNGPELWEYVESKKVQVIPFEKLRFGKALSAFNKALKRLCAACDAVAVSLDLDAAAEAHAPGVSAPQAEGFASSEIIAMAEAAGREKKVVSLGIFELNPEHDIGEQTARLAATTAYHFVLAAASFRGDR